MKRPMHVNDLANALDQEQSMISHNLKLLLDCNFVYSEPRGKTRVYSANKETVESLFRVVENHAQNFCPTKGKCHLK